MIVTDLVMVVEVQLTKLKSKSLQDKVFGSAKNSCKPADFRQLLKFICGILSRVIVFTLDLSKSRINPRINYNIKILTVSQIDRL